MVWHTGYESRESKSEMQTFAGKAGADSGKVGTFIDIPALPLKRYKLGDS